MILSQLPGYHFLKILLIVKLQNESNRNKTEFKKRKEKKDD